MLSGRWALPRTILLVMLCLAMLPAPVAAQPSTPASSAPEAVAQARALHGALLRTAIGTADLPSGFSVVRVSQMAPARGAVEENLVGTILVELDGPDLANRIIFEVYPRDTDATRRLAGIGLEAGQVRTDSFTPTDFDEPAGCVSFHDGRSDPEYGGTVCIVQSKEVVVYGSSALSGDADRGEAAHAVGLARAGLDHIERVRAGLPPGTDAAQAGGAQLAPSVRAANLIHSRLGGTPFGDSELPRGFSVARVSTPPSLDQALLFDVVGTVLVDIGGPDDSNAILYEVYPDVPSARSRFEQTGPSGDATPTDSFRPAGFTDPARCYSFFAPAGDPEFGATFCLALIENVMVLGASVLDGDFDRGYAENAIGLTRSGVAHLKGVLAGLPSGTVADTERPGRAVQDEGIDHVAPGTPVERRHQPPASGPHYPSPLQRGVYTEEQDPGYWIHSLEHGYIVLLYNCSTDCAALQTQLRQFYESVPKSAAYGYQKLIVVPYSQLSQRLAIVAWNRIDEMDQFDAQRLLRFYEAYHDRGPEDAP